MSQIYYFFKKNLQTPAAYVLPPRSAPPRPCRLAAVSSTPPVAASSTSLPPSPSTDDPF